MRSIWQSIPVDEALDMLQFWVDTNWLMTEREAAELASEIGWTQDQDGWVSNDRFGLSFPDVEGIGPADDPVKTKWSPAEWMLLLLSSVLWWADLVQSEGGEAFEFGVGAGADLESP
ncbi:hypothetical protein [Serinicoccus profundi]|uniref:hypothetical protein n=1 Tax=Serinicoccus profundi TaxID=1078471 RepID=UPI0011474AC6|nr:hypothetical protein [Serinicoccus profundi]